MAASALNLPRNYSLYTIPVAWVISVAPHLYASSLGKFDNRHPRSYTRTSEADQSIDKATKDCIARAEGAQMNGFENLGLFASAVVIGNVAKLDNALLNQLSVGYLASRIIYNFVYINNTTNTLAGARTLSFFAGVGIIWTLFIKSANVLRDSL